jgi:hypothetical protein
MSFEPSADYKFAQYLGCYKDHREPSLDTTIKSIFEFGEVSFSTNYNSYMDS